MEDDSIVFYESPLLASNIRREVINVLDSFLSFLKKYENKKAHNMIFLMLNPKFLQLYCHYHVAYLSLKCNVCKTMIQTKL
jgi:hypothetical protein